MAKLGELAENGAPVEDIVLQKVRVGLELVLTGLLLSGKP